jgi:hypothetical protein
MKAFGFLQGVVAFVGLLAANFGDSSLRAEILFRDSFNTNGTLVGTTPSTGGVWTQTGTIATNPLTVTSNALVFAASGQDAFAAFSSPAAKTSGDRLFAGFDINLSTATAGGDYFLHLSDPAGTTNNFYNRIYARSATGGFQLGLASFSGTGSVITYGSGVLNFAQTYRIVSSWEFVAGTSNDILDLYVNASDATQSNNTAYIGGYVWTGSPEPTTNVSAINVRQGGATSSAILSLDNLIVTRNDFALAANLSAVPEPASMLLLGVAGVGGLAFRRFRRKAAGSETLAS